MKRAVRVAALFTAYGAIGYGGDFAVSLVAQEVRARFAQDAAEVRRTDASEAHVHEVDRPDVVVAVKPAIVSRLQVRRASSCAYRTERKFDVSVEASEGLRIEAGSGELLVEGRDDLEEVVVVGLVCASHEGYLDDLDVRVVRNGDERVLIETVYPRDRDRHDGRDVARIDLTVLVPRGMSVEVDDASGDAEVLGTGDLRIDDSSGDLRVHDVEGTLRIRDSSGGLEVQGVSGDVDIEDGSGGIDVRGIGGSLHLRDGSGGIEASGIDGDVVVERDGSGGIDVRDVGGDFIVNRDGSGGIRHSGVTGRVDIPRR